MSHEQSLAAKYAASGKDTLYRAQDRIRKAFCALLLVLSVNVCFFALPSLAEETEQLGTLRVCNCNEWVSLRKKASTESERLIKVPLGEYVENSVRYNAGWIRCEYKGKTGYIQSKYLEKAPVATPAPTAVPTREPVQDVPGEVVSAPVQDTVSVPCEARYLDMMSGGGECLLLQSLSSGDYRFTVCAVRETTQREESVCTAVLDSNLQTIWARRMSTEEIGQYEPFHVFIGGTLEEPYVMLYNAQAGLEAVRLNDGETVWILSRAAYRLGSGICCAVAGDGTMYIAGADGPHPVAVSVRGTLLWSANPGNDDIYWPYQITLTEDGVVTDYDSGDITGGRAHYRVTYSYFGETVNIELVK